MLRHQSDTSTGSSSKPESGKLQFATAGVNTAEVSELQFRAAVDLIGSLYSGFVRLAGTKSFLVATKLLRDGITKPRDNLLETVASGALRISRPAD